MLALPRHASMAPYAKRQSLGILGSWSLEVIERLRFDNRALFRIEVEGVNADRFGKRIDIDVAQGWGKIELCFR